MEWKIKTDIKNPERLQLKYLEKFKCCFGRILSAKEICEKTKISMSLFSDKYLPRLQELYLICEVSSMLPLEKKITRKFYKENYDWSPVNKKTKKYYYFTPKSSNKNILFVKIFPYLRDIMNDGEKIEREFFGNFGFLQIWEFSEPIFRTKEFDFYKTGTLLLKKEFDEFIENVNNNLDIGKILRLS